MLRKLLNQILRSTLIAALVTTSIATIAFAQDTAPAAPTATPPTLSARQVTGFLPGGQFAKIWLELRPDFVGAEVKLVANWDRENVNPTEIGFFVLDSSKFLAVLGGGTLRDNNLLTATPLSDGSSNQLGVIYTATDVNAYTVVLYNDGSTGGGFTLTATNATLIDGSGQVKDPNAKESVATEAPAAVTTAAPTTAPVTVAVTTTTAPATVAVTTTDTTTTGTTSTQPVAAPAIVTKEVRGEKMEGELPKQFDQHYLGLEPSERDGSIQLTLTFDPQDNTELARKMNFWVLDDVGFRRFLDGSRLSEVAIAAGNRTFGDENNVRVANFTANGTAPMVVVVYNNSEIAATYSLTAKGATLVDDSGQTKTAKSEGAIVTTQPAAAVATTSPVTTTDTGATVATTAPTAAPAQPAATPAPASTTPQQGTSYTIKRGDSISIIARDVYGDINLYDEICTFNRIANCDTIEVGDVVQLPTKDQLTSGATAPAAAAPTPTTAPAPAAAAPVTNTAVTTATTTTTTTTTSAPAATPTKAPAASDSTTVTNTQTTTTTTTAKPTPTPTKAPVSSTGTTTTTTTTAASGDIVAVLQANGNFSILVDLLKAAGLEKTLKGPSTFTVFAPTDAAFNALPAGAVDQLKANPGGQLTQVLLFHVLSGQTLSADITSGLESTTMTGSQIAFTKSGNNIKVQDSVIVTKDIKASNGAIHVIDKVMIPPAQ